MNTFDETYFAFLLKKESIPYIHEERYDKYIDTDKNYKFDFSFEYKDKLWLVELTGLASKSPVNREKRRVAHANPHLNILWIKSDKLKKCREIEHIFQYNMIDRYRRYVLNKNKRKNSK